jgi:hypothetical protein
LITKEKGEGKKQIGSSNRRKMGKGEKEADTR